MIPNFRPRILQYQVIIEGYEDYLGDYHPGTSFFEGSIPCRYELNNKANQMTFEDGKVYVYQYVVYLNQNCREFKIGDVIRLLNNGCVIAENRFKVFTEDN